LPTPHKIGVLTKNEWNAYAFTNRAASGVKPPPATRKSSRRKFTAQPSPGEMEFLIDDAVALEDATLELKHKLISHGKCTATLRAQVEDKAKKRKLQKNATKTKQKTASMKEDGRYIDRRTTTGKVWVEEHAKEVCRRANVERIRLHMRGQAKNGRNVTAAAQKYAVLLLVKAGLHYSNLQAACQLFEEWLSGAGEASTDDSFKYMTRQ